MKGNDVYYQGKTTKKLPVSIQIEYKLDGKKIDAKDLEGKSGKLEMQITFTNNISKQINANGKTVTIHPSYLAGGMMDLDTDVFKNVTCKQGKMSTTARTRFWRSPRFPAFLRRSMRPDWKR